MSAPPCTSARLIAALRALMGGVRLESGYVDCDVWTNERADDGENLVHYEERWATEDAMAARVRSGQFTKLLEVVEGAPEAPRVEFEFVERRQGLEYVEAIRGAQP